MPAAALGQRDRQGMTTVRVLDEAGKAQPRRVLVGINNNINAQILEGLAVGEKVVVGEAAPAGSQATPARAPRMRL